MKRTLVLVATLWAAAPAGAFWFEELYCYLETHRAENNRWPEQYIEQDRINAAAPFDIMVRNGWRRQNLLGSHHFTEDGAELTRAGELRVQYILTQTPPDHRQIFVERSLEAEVTQQRIDTANAFASTIVLAGVAPQAQDTHILSDGRPATVVDFVNSQYQQNMRIPTLPQGGAPAPTE
ncbi:hypothetical protein [Botrimarina sp.]|uniref:hypothetical protein n=1 Tax=Botrimarina sp. TaxID=2795802 RepID=UPI0032ED3212